jgi:predicted secreted hydrolase
MTRSGGQRGRGAVGSSMILLGAILGSVLAACSGPILANPPAPRATPPSPTPAPTPPADPQPIVFPRDDGPHDRLTEWWYVTGHLRGPAGERFGFEFVVFRAERGALPVSWASHLALTDETAGTFHFAQRSELGPQVDRSPRDASGTPSGFALAVTGFDPRRTDAVPPEPWVMAGADDRLRLQAGLTPEEAAAAELAGGFRLDLGLAALRPPVLHDGDGWVDFGPAGGSYYYSRTRLGVRGTLVLGERVVPVDGLAWFDHQWGDFIAVGGGWDWFAVNLDDGTDLTISLVRSPDGRPTLAYGTLVAPDGTARHLPASAFGVTVLGSWTSPRSGARYPAGWRIEVPAEALVVELRPTVADQELDTRATTGVVYWEGSQLVRASRAGRPLSGLAYVELTGYATGELRGGGVSGD